MGTFFVDALLAAPERPERREPVKLLVDSGSTYTWVAAPVLRALSVEPTERRRVLTIEGQIAERDAARRATSTCSAPTRSKDLHSGSIPCCAS